MKYYPNELYILDRKESGSNIFHARNSNLVFNSYILNKTKNHFTRIFGLT